MNGPSQSLVIGARCSPIVDTKHSLAAQRRSPAVDLQTSSGQLSQSSVDAGVTSLGNG